jgi:hypothetical protein
MNLSLEYIAGLFDGEGSISIYAAGAGVRHRPSPYYCLQITITNSHEGVLRAVRESLGCGVIVAVKGGKASRRLCFGWVVSSKAAGRVLALLLPYLVIKRQRAELAIRFQGTMQNGHVGRKRLPESLLEQRAKMRAEMFVLNREYRPGSKENPPIMKALP